MSVPGRTGEFANGRFVEAKQGKRRLAVRLLWSNPSGRFGSIADERFKWRLVTRVFGLPRVRWASAKLRCALGVLRSRYRFRAQPIGGLARLSMDAGENDRLHALIFLLL